MNRPCFDYAQRTRQRVAALTMPIVTTLITATLVTGAGAQAAGIVAVDQAGYPALARKTAILTAYADSFQVINTATRAVKHRGVVDMASLGDAATGMELYRADFSSLSLPGDYLVRTSAGDTSAHFTITDSVYIPVFRASLKGFFYQRCGVFLSPISAGLWWHPACHTSTDAMFHATAESTGVAQASGGWHDAGDYGKYVVNAGITVGTLLMAYEWFPSRFSTDNLQIPESGNGVPDILDEARHELAWLFTMQAAGGGVFFKITKPQFEAFVMPDKDPGQRYIYRLSSTATGDFAAMMARAARVYRPFDSTFSAKCLGAAVRAWQYLQASPSIVPTGGFKNPAGTATGEYGDGDDSDERLWAAVELYLANGDNAAHTYFINNYSSKGIITGAMWWGNVRTLAECAYLRGSRPDINPTVQENIRQSLLAYGQGVITLRDNSGFRTAIRTSDYGWGSNSQVLNNAILLILGKGAGGNQEFEEAALEQLHYILGVNVHGQSFVTGIGARSTLRPHHRPSGSDGIAAPVPGLLSGGPDRNITDDPVLAAKFTAATPPALCYVDDQGSYASNEIAVNWNAPLVFVAGYFAKDLGGTSVSPGTTPLPRDIRLNQNFPNPFNGSTVISFSLSRAMDVDLRVVDLLGRNVSSMNLGPLTAGEHRTMWSAEGTMLSSGSYFYFLSSAGRTVSDVRTLVLLR